MTLNDIIKEYDRRRNDSYHENSEFYYSDMCKKLKRSFECLGLDDLSCFKDESGKEYCFFESDMEYIFHLLDQETSTFCKNVRKNEMTEDDYERMVDEVKILREFIKRYDDDEEQCQAIINEIDSKTRYPILKQHYDAKIYYNNFICYYESFVSDEGVLKGITNWEYLTAQDKLRLFKELVEFTKKWVKLVEDVGEMRSEESWENFFELAGENYDEKDIRTYCIVEQAVAKELESKLEESTDKKTPNPRSLKAELNKAKKEEEKFRKLKLRTAKRFCEERGFDFEKYLSQKESIESFEYEPMTTEELLEQLNADD